LRRNVKITNRILLEERIREFLCEDLGSGDITSEYLIDAGLEGVAFIICREDAVVAGLEEVSILFSLLGCDVEQLIPDGEAVKKDQVLMEIRGDVRSILLGERTALNLLMRMSGIATATSAAIKKAESKNSGVRIAATRKTVPGLRFFDKKAVAVGGGDTHRLRLDDCILVKNNHISAVGSIAEAVRRAREKVSFTKKVEVEAGNMREVLDAAEAGADVIMLDNFSPDQIQKTITRLEGIGIRKNLLIESSGGITLGNLEEYAATGVDVISLGALTHSVRAINMNLRLRE
jgi:nicotinate-nucleotide pyrophosphorylase (carboxylating)